ncbi:hypothetical protein C9I98_11250 [Photobacterium sanctipauli]|uniref:Oligosaccharide repeat unit polymerase n=3 Tax=Photobacterium sanctipauli TaxID=1342794 RepID=A0A2T3NTA0_9GAMM|nr:O-antigen polymerase [Photobacterium sanctipauli]PSW19488.1 hypothetical protein C9I98_11250 [Photobacterium sanctipauli]
MNKTNLIFIIAILLYLPLYLLDNVNNLVYIASFVFLLSIALPAVIFNYEDFYQPIIFKSLLTLGFMFFPSIYGYVFGIDEHVLLSGYLSKIELNNYLIFYLILFSIFNISTLFSYLITPNIKFKNAPYYKIRANKLDCFFIIGFLFNVFCLSVFIAKGGLNSLLYLRSFSGDERITNVLGGTWVFLGQIIIPVSFIAFHALSKGNYTNKVIVFILCLSSLASIFLLTGSRSGVAYYLIFIAVIYLYNGNKLNIKYSIFGVLSLLILFATLSGLRSSGEEYEAKVNLSESVSSIFKERSERTVGYINGVYPIFHFLGDRSQLKYGETYINWLFAPIPRSIYPNKPQGVGKLNAVENYSRDDTAIPPGVVGESYWNFGVFGVIIVGLFWGVFLKILWSYHQSKKKDTFSGLLYILTLFYFNPETTSFYSWIQIIVPVIFMVTILKYGEKNE